MSLGVIVLFALFGGCSVTRAFDEAKFKKCEDAAFCKRNRHVVHQEHYSVVPSSVVVVASETELRGRIRNDPVDKEFPFTLTSVSGGALRFQLTEDAPVQRYQVKDVLIADPLAAGASWTIQRQTEQEVALKLQEGAIEVTLRYKPFHLMVRQEGRELLYINGNDMFHLENTREKSDEAPEGEWEESFKAFKDSKPKGPQAISLDVTYVGMSNVFGIPEHSTHLSLPVTMQDGEAVSEPYRLYNLDVFEYDLDSPFGLYGSIPFLLGQSMKASAGVFWLNSAEMLIDIWKDDRGVHSQWIAESGVLDVFLMAGSSAKGVLQQYAALTGTTSMPQYFALGYHQCRWNYKDEADVKYVDATFDEYGIPYDVLWLDIEHTDQKKYMTWDATAFPNPVAMQEDLASRGRKMVVIIDPHIKKDDRYPVYTEAKKKGFYVKNPDGSDFVGHCWPGSSSYLDVNRQEVRSWWARRFELGAYEGMTKYLYVWNDMNEPSVFNGPEMTMQKDLMHSGRDEHRDVHNLYGYFYHMATTEGLQLRGRQLYGSNGDRPFVLSRAYFAGSQRLGPIWTGDNAASWSHLKASIPMLLSNNLAGMAFCGADIGGFFGNPNSELFTRWYQVGAFYPFARGHAHIETKRREPWVFGEETTMRVRKALRERYALLPYIYTLFRFNNLTGEPILRPLWYEFLHEELFEMDEQFMLGPALMIRPIFEERVTQIDTFFPPDTCWYDAWSGEKIETTPEHPSRSVQVDLEKIPFYYRGGSIVIRKERPRRSTVAMKQDPVTLIVAPDANGMAEGEVYMDDGQSYAFQRLQYLHRKFTFADNRLRSVNLNTNRHRDIKFTATIQVEKIVILGMTSKMQVSEATSLMHFEASLGPLRLEKGAPVAGLVIKKPELSVDADWALHLSLPKQ